MTRIVLAYSGGLETSIAIPWLADRHAAEIIAVTMDLGQGKEVLEEIRDRALATGALRAHVVDVRDAFARDYIVRALKAGILGDLSPVAASLAHPLIAQKLVEIANIEQATIAAHGDPAGSASPLERTIRALDPTMTVLAPAGEWGMTLDQQLAYARERHVTLPVEYSGLGDRASAPRAITLKSGEPASVEIAFEHCGLDAKRVALRGPPRQLVEVHAHERPIGIAGRQRHRARGSRPDRRRGLLRDGRSRLLGAAAAAADHAHETQTRNRPSHQSASNMCA